MLIKICPKEGTPYFAMPAKQKARRQEFREWLTKYNVAMDYQDTDIVRFDNEQNLSVFLMTWPHGYEVVE
jgi:hypothetical protein